MKDLDSVSTLIAHKQIAELNASDDPRDKSHAMLLTMGLNLATKVDEHSERMNKRMDRQDQEIATIKGDVAETKAETKKTNGRVNKHDVNFEELNKLFRTLLDALSERVNALEIPAQRAKWTWQFVTKVCTIATVIAGLIFSLMSSPAWPKSQPTQSQADEIALAVAKAIRAVPAAPVAPAKP